MWSPLDGVEVKFTTTSGVCFIISNKRLITVVGMIVKKILSPYTICINTHMYIITLANQRYEYAYCWLPNTSSSLDKRYKLQKSYNSQLRVLWHFLSFKRDECLTDTRFKNRLQWIRNERFMEPLFGVIAGGTGTATKKTLHLAHVRK